MKHSEKCSVQNVPGFDLGHNINGAYLTCNKHVQGIATTCSNAHRNYLDSCKVTVPARSKAFEGEFLFKAAYKLYL